MTIEKKARLFLSFSTLLVVSSFAEIAAAQSRAASVAPTPEQVNQAIYQGVTHRGQSQGLVLIDAGSQFGQALAVMNAASGKQKPWDQSPASGFTITIFTPQSWIAQQASDAANAGRAFTAQDVSADMLRPVIRIAALPSTPPPAGSGWNFGQDVSSVGDITLADASRNNLIEPTNRAPFSYQNLTGLMVEFPLEDLARVRQSNPEFYILVTGPNNSHNFKVKRKHLFRLPF